MHLAARHLDGSAIRHVSASCTAIVTARQRLQPEREVVVKVLCAVLVSALVGGLPCLSHAQTTSDSSIDQIIAPQAVPADAAVVTPSQPAVFKSGVDLVALKVIVTDPRQKYVTDLAQGDFAVYEDGVMQDVSYFAMGAVPLDLAI